MKALDPYNFLNFLCNLYYNLLIHNYFENKISSSTQNYNLQFSSAQSLSFEEYYGGKTFGIRLTILKSNKRVSIPGFLLGWNFLPAPWGKNTPVPHDLCPDSKKIASIPDPPFPSFGFNSYDLDPYFEYCCINQFSVRRN